MGTVGGVQLRGRGEEVEGSGHAARVFVYFRIAEGCLAR
jgi:hypothetical protein